MLGSGLGTLRTVLLCMELLLYPNPVLIKMNRCCMLIYFLSIYLKSIALVLHWSLTRFLCLVVYSSQVVIDVLDRIVGILHRGSEAVLRICCGQL